MKIAKLKFPAVVSGFILLMGSGVAFADSATLDQLYGAAHDPSGVYDGAIARSGSPVVITMNPMTDTVPSMPAAPAVTSAVSEITPLAPSKDIKDIKERVPSLNGGEKSAGGSAVGAAGGFMGGFLLVMSPAIALGSIIPLAGKLLGAVLFVPAVVVGVVTALIGAVVGAIVS